MNKILTLLPFYYERVIWHYKYADIIHINRAMEMFNWENVLELDDVDNQVSTFNEVFLNIIANYIPNEIILCDDRDPPWFNKHIKSLINNTNRIFKSFMNSRNTPVFKCN